MESKTGATGEALREDAYPQNDSVGLLPCPFCGGRPFRTRTVNGTQMYKVGCGPCGIVFKAAWYRDAAAPTKNIDVVWNTRAHSVSPSPCQKCGEHEEREAAVCPEDVGCIEYIGILERQRDSLRAVVVELEKALTDINEYACYTEENYGEGACGQVLHWIGTTARAALTKVQAEKNSG